MNSFEIICEKNGRKSIQIQGRGNILRFKIYGRKTIRTILNLYNSFGIDELSDIMSRLFLIMPPDIMWKMGVNIKVVIL